MKISSLPRGHVPIILGDIGVHRELPKVTEQEIFDMQPESTKELMLMDPSQPFVMKRAWGAPHIKIVPTFDDQGNLTRVQADDRIIEGEDLQLFMQHRRSSKKEAYRADLTTVMHHNNKDGKFEGGTPDWQKHMLTKTLEHNSEVGLNKFEKSQQTKEEPKSDSWFSRALKRYWSSGSDEVYMDWRTWNSLQAMKDKNIFKDKK